MRKTKCQFTSFVIFTQVTNVTAFYYVICFTIIYEKSALAWVEGVALTLFLDFFVFDFGFQLIQAGLRSFLKGCSLVG